MHNRLSGGATPSWASPPLTRLATDKDACCAIRLPSPAPHARLRPVLVQVGPAEDRPRRRRIWELGGTLHCSIIGTCIPTEELRRLLRKLGLGGPEATDHGLHGIAVGAAGRQDMAAKQINKCLDDRYRAVIRRFEAAEDSVALRGLWRVAMEAGDIPGAYWTVLTHPAADPKLITEVFGDVHMLSHLVGAANRADIRRLAAQDKELAALRGKVAQQQVRLRDGLTARDARIAALQRLLAERTLREAPETSPETSTEVAEWQNLAAALEARLRREETRRETAERKMEAQAQAATQAMRDRDRLRDEIAELRREVAAAEAMLAGEATESAPPQMSGLVLYVGGRSGQTAELRRIAARGGAELLHHDAEAGSSLLPGLVGRADLVVFPVDCVSHDAALAVKRLCRQFGRPFRPLRSTGAASLAAALRGQGDAA